MATFKKNTKTNAFMSTKSLIIALKEWVQQNSSAPENYQLDGRINENNPEKWIYFRYRGQSDKHYGIFAINADTKIIAVKRLIERSENDLPLFNEDFTIGVNTPSLKIKEDSEGFYCYKIPA